MNFLLPGKLTQDAVENLFSQVRSKGNSHPKACQFRNAIKLISVGQFLHVPSSGNYDTDDSENLITFIKEHSNASYSLTNDEPQPNIEINEVDALIESAVVCMDICESNGLYYILGWAVFKELKNIEKCETLNINRKFDAPDSSITVPA
ncbi:uncharacterized protein LOC120327068 [Styela clava]